nr:MAG TPA: hypothetical protein [Caudoviricetes sp.]
MQRLPCRIQRRVLRRQNRRQISQALVATPIHSDRRLPWNRRKL